MGQMAEQRGSPGALTKQFFGEATSGTQNANQVTHTDFRPEDLARIEAQRAAFQKATGGVSSLTGALQRQAAQQGPQQLYTNINLPQGGINLNAPTGLDALGRGAVAQGTQALQQQAGAQQRALAAQFAGQPGIAQALARQAASQTRLQTNPLAFQAAQDSFNRQMQGQQQQLQGAQLLNAALTGQQQLQQANRAEQLGYGQAGLAAQQGLLSALSQLGQQLGTQYTNTSTTQNARSGGVAQGLGIK